MAERKILAAQAEGKLSGLKGEGKPLPNQREVPHSNISEQVGFNIMARAGAAPEEVTLSKRIADARDALKSAASAEEEARAMRKLADLQMRFSMLQEARRRGVR